MEKKQALFSSKIGMIAAAAGSAVGLGNIWKFPYEAGQNGGGAFLLVYILCVFLLGIPVMMSELLIGRASKQSPRKAYKALGGRSPWQIVGGLGIFSAFLVCGFYLVVTGWTLEYTYQSMVNGLSGLNPGELSTHFKDFTSLSYRPMYWTLLAIGINIFILLRGVQKGIENFSKIMMPLLVIILFVLAIRTLTLDGAMEGLKFYLQPHFKDFTSQTFLSALGQAFFSLSIGLGIMITYGAYMDKSQSLTKTSTQIALIDTIIAIVAGLIVFPACLSMGIQPDQGPQLVFVTLPTVFNNMWGGYIFSILFFALLTLAALTSTMSIMEVCIAALIDELKISRIKSTLIIMVACVVLCLLAALPMNHFHIMLGESTLFSALDFITTKLFIPIAGFFAAIYVSYIIDKKVVKDQLSNQGKELSTYAKVLLWLLRYVAPLAIAIVFIYGLIG